MTTAGSESRSVAHQPRAPPLEDETDAYSIEEFCRRHRISVQLFYKFRHEMPPTFKIGARRLITREAAAAWRREREAATA
ncbi:hypothetical protein IVB18_31930 [Bradyrhizobium sp. 186]|nr:hypothetical protein IVB18_31930 [Bradyrhizobium sp. 186]